MPQETQQAISITIGSSLSLSLTDFPPTPSTMVSLESAQAASRSMDITCSPRISFSLDFLDDKNFISLSPNSGIEKIADIERDKARSISIDFEFLSTTDSATDTMLTPDELFSEGKLLPFWQMQQLDKLNKINLKPKEKDEEEKEASKEENRVSWFIDEDPSPRPPKCTVLWKELLRMKKQRASSLSPSSSTSSSSSTLSSDSNVHDTGTVEAVKVSKESIWNREKHVKRIKQGLERTRSASIRIRPVVNVPICTQGKSSVLPPLFSLKKGNVER